MDKKNQKKKLMASPKRKAYEHDDGDSHSKKQRTPTSTPTDATPTSTPTDATPTSTPTSTPNPTHTAAKEDDGIVGSIDLENYRLKALLLEKKWAKHGDACLKIQAEQAEIALHGSSSTVAQMTNLGNPAVHVPPVRGPIAPPIPDSHGPLASAVKTRMCNKFNTAEGCKFGDKCHFAHGERELSKPFLPSHDVPMGGAPPMMDPGRMAARMELPPPAGFGAAASFGALTTLKTSIDASLAGAIIGKRGVNTKQIFRVTGAKLTIRDHEADAKLRNIELEGTFDQIIQATVMVRKLIVDAQSPVNFKTRLCLNFTCTFGDKCHFAHGVNELRKHVA